MTPEISLAVVTFIAAGLCVVAGGMHARINSLHAQLDHELAFTQKAIDERDHALKEAKVEADLRRQAEKNLAEANEAARDWRNDAMLYEARLAAVKVTRDPKTGRMVSTKAKTAQEMAWGFTAFDAMMGNPKDQLNGLTVRRLCDEVKENASAGI